MPPRGFSRGYIRDTPTATIQSQFAGYNIHDVYATWKAYLNTDKQKPNPKRNPDCCKFLIKVKPIQSFYSLEELAEGEPCVCCKSGVLTLRVPEFGMWISPKKYVKYLECKSCGKVSFKIPLTEYEKFEIEAKQKQEHEKFMASYKEMMKKSVVGVYDSYFILDESSTREPVKKTWKDFAKENERYKMKTKYRR